MNSVSRRFIYWAVQGAWLTLSSDPMTPKRLLNSKRAALHPAQPELTPYPEGRFAPLESV